MPTVPLPENPSLEHLKAQAKLVRDLIRSGDDGALAMVDEFHPRLGAADLAPEARARFKTSEAQLVIARLYGFSAWPRLRAHLDQIDAVVFDPHEADPESADHVDRFVRAACLDYASEGPSPADRLAEAHRLLAQDPSLAGRSPAAMATVGDHQALTRVLDDDPDAVAAIQGPNRWPLLLYATYARIEADEPGWSAVETVRLLLDRGADANVGFLWRGLVPPFTALTGAFGGGESHQPWHRDRLELARLLLEAGADPNDGQALYNNGIGGQNHDDPAHLELLVARGLGTDTGGPWYRRFGDRLRAPEELLYDELEAAAVRGRPTICRYLLSLGLDPDRPVGRSQEQPARLAAANGHGEVLAVLAEAGVDAELTPMEQGLAAVRAGDSAALQLLLAAEPDLVARLRATHPGLCRSVPADSPGMLSLLLELGFDINDRHDTKTALHAAAEGDDVAAARLLIDHGADPDLVDTHIRATPLDWAAHFGNDAVARLLRPLTTDGPHRAEFVISHGGLSRLLASPPLIERALDAIAAEVEGPTLVAVSHGRTTLTIGLGHPELSVALFGDGAGGAWFATTGGPETAAALAESDHLSFIHGDLRRHFTADAAIGAGRARELVRRFVADPDEPPSLVEWVREGS